MEGIMNRSVATRDELLNSFNWQRGRGEPDHEEDAWRRVRTEKKIRATLLTHAETQDREPGADALIAQLDNLSQRLEGRGISRPRDETAMLF